MATPPVHRVMFRRAAVAARLIAIFLPAWSAAQPVASPSAQQVARQLDSTPAVRHYPIDPERAPRPTMSAVRAARAPVIDGNLEDAEWARADSATEFVQQLPATGARALYRTVVRVLYDSDHIYVGAVNYDPRPGLAITAGLQRDFVSSNSDVFAVVLDTYHDRSNSFLFIVNPKGAVRDEQTFNDSRTIVEA